MKTAGRRRERTIFRSWVISYSAILLVPLVFNLFIYFQGRQAMEADYQNTQYTVVENLADVMERELMRLNEFSSKLANEPRVLDFFAAASMEDYRRDFQASLALQGMEDALFLALPQTSVVREYYLIAPSGLVWTGNGLYGRDDPLLPSGAYVRRVFSMLDGELAGALLIPPIEGVMAQCSILYPLPSAYQPLGYLAVSLDSRAIDEILRQVSETNHARLYITAESGEILYRSQTARERPMEEALLASGETERGKAAWAYAIPSTTLALRYQVVAPFEPEDMNLFYLRFILMLSFLIGILGGGFLVFLVARRNYTPVRALVETVSSQSEELQPEGANEYQLVSEALRGLYAQRNSIREVVNRQNRTLFAYYLSELMKNRIPAWDIDEETLQSMEGDLGLGSFCVLLVLTDFAHDRAEHDDLVQTAFSALYEANFLEVLRERLGASFSVTPTRVYDYEACVISIQDESSQSWQADVREAADAAARQYAQAVSCRSYLACSGLYHGAVSLSEAYEEVSELMPYAVIENNATVYREDVLPPGNLSPSSDEADLRALTNLVHAGSAEALREKLLEIVGRFSSENFSFHTLKGVSIGLVGHMIVSGGPWNENERIQLLHRLSRLDRETTLDRVKGGLCETAELVCQLRRKPEAPNRKDALVRKVERELEAHLYDEEMNIMFLARNLDMNPKYLSSVYQEATGVNLMDVIHKRRVERFKELVTKERMSVKDAAAKVGYTSVVTLNRWFKKFEGTTPGKWKEN